MTLRILLTASCFASLAAALALPLSHLAAQDIGPPAPADAVPGDFNPLPVTEGVEVMTRGVIHEAFAEVASDPKPGLIVSKRPPETIEEVPPEFKPEEEGAIWISGYWAWDDERDDFFWQSGVWRVPPPAQRWVAGYWNEVPSGWQWVSGFWVPVETKEIRYYDAPPASLEAGPTSPAPSDNYFWATGSWNYDDTSYRWQPGYWAPYQENWVWISPRYAWTPAGCVYLPGRWDYRLTRRGCLFAPVYYTQPVYLRPNYVYRPWCALNTPNLFVHLWVRPNYGHFYFGNYYDSNWGNWGVTPWCQYQPYRNCYDPMLTQLQCHYRQSGVNFISRLDGWHNHYVNNVSSRPPQTWNEQVRIMNQTNITHVKQNILAVNLQDASKRNDLNVKFAHLDGNKQKQAISQVKETREVRQHRISVERPEGFATRDQVRLKLPATQVTTTVKQPEKLLPPKVAHPLVSQPQVDLPDNVTKNRDDGRVFIGSREPKRGVEVIDITPVPPGTVMPPSINLPPLSTSQSNVAPQPPANVEAPRPRDAGVTTPGGSRSTPGGTRTPDFPSLPFPPRGPVPRPGPDGNFPTTTTPGGSRSTPGGTRTPDFPSRPIPPGGPVPRAPLPRQGGPALPQTPKVEMPRPGSRIDFPRPQPKLESSVPRHDSIARPQIKLDIPQRAVKMESGPRLQPTPSIQPAPRVETPRHEPHRGGENHPPGGRSKPA